MASTIEEFGSQLINTQDLDPTYVALGKVNWVNDDHKKRWLLSYWCMYHTGVASYMSELEGAEYWEVFQTAAENIEECPVGGRWPRAKARRHFRARNALVALAELRQRYRLPEHMADGCIAAGPTVGGVVRYAESHFGFGNNVAWKIADMLEICFQAPIDFTNGEQYLPRVPRESALRLWATRHPEESLPPEIDRLRWVCAQLLGHFKDVKAPPNYNRNVNLQEVETMCCKWTHHSGGYYPVGRDTFGIFDETKPWIAFQTAREFHTGIPSREGLVR